MKDEIAWVFVSHSSVDLEKVRQIRNFMEEQGAGPILFHLRSLTQPEAFWPLIEQEISARNFFLFCDSAAARSSVWVPRERETVAAIANKRAIRVGRIDLDANELDFERLRRFLLNTQVFVVGEHNVAFPILSSLGYRIIGAVTFSAEGLRRLGDGTQMSNDMIDHLDYAASRGWLLVVLSQATVDSEGFWRELPHPSAQDRVMFIQPLEVVMRGPAPKLPPELLVAQSGSLESAIVEAAQRMLSGGPD